jgi:nucleotide-binding universal stress UspA family protein
MITIRRILCPTDMSELSGRAFRHAMAFAKWYEAELDVLYVVPAVVPHPGVMPPGPSWALFDPEARSQVEDELHYFVAPAENEGIHVRRTIRDGDVVAEILKEARAIPADLMVMGTHGRGGFERWILGSITEKAMRKAPCPVLTVPPAGADQPLDPVQLKKILCPVDFSDASMTALRHALSLAEEADAELVVLHVLEWGSEAEPQLQPGLSAPPEYHRLLEQNARERLRSAIPDEAREWCHPEEVVVFGRAYQQILTEAKQRQAQMIVMGVHGRSALDILLFGSTTHHVIRVACCPVLTIQPESRRDLLAREGG